ncbi:hypothetical protein M885DRAFT_610524 [Pelagophyceae sp. CCMP2097]|nr:hypothetical protein M885DRAFT_610524 [Pelagophyceae sp. CCMP2097]|mmetsp:Transcript_7376/g.25846  ORF Transcript_7376/g.25846 Transcript_7376/m.25846 type:complete len:272 (+) Transcript_7376:71-886(+)
MADEGRYALLGAPGLTSTNALELLLSSQWVEGHWVQTPCELTRLSALEWSTRPVEGFNFAGSLELPDNPPRPGPRSTAIHRFALADFDTLNHGLVQAALAAKADLTIVSNVGGTHSAEEVFADDPEAWYAAISKLLERAIKTVAGAQVESATGWLNSSAAWDYNTLHDHGTADWSAVYFAASGESDARAACAVDRTDAGALILRFQLKPFSHDYAFLAIRPTPGDLWLFPGHVAHAVMPRALSRGDATEDAAGDAARVSVACNVILRRSAS